MVRTEPLPNAQSMNGDAPVVLLERRDGVAWVTLNRPRSLNAMSAELMDLLHDTLREVADDDEVRCVVLRGAGRAFCAGGDVGMMSDNRSGVSGADAIGTLLDQQHRALVRRSSSTVLLASMAKPTVAVIHGHVVGGGMSLALACDFRLAADDTKLRAGFRRNALSGDFGLGWLLDAAVGRPRASELLMLDPVVDAETARADGLVHEVVPLDALEDRALTYVAELSEGPTIALGRMKRNLLAARTMALPEAIEFEALNQRVSAMSADAAEAGRAFVEKRAPQFEGR